MNQLKKIIAGAMVLALCITTVQAPATASAATATTAVNISVAATVLDVTITPSITVPLLNPNSLTYSVASLLKINIQNNSKAPIKVTLASFTPAEDCDFTLVAPDKYTDWTKLTKAQSKEIAMTYEAQSFKSASVQTYRAGIDPFVGTIDPNGLASLKLSAVFAGHSYTGTTNATFNVTFAVELE